MVVRTQGKGRDVTGLYIGPRNARRNFPRHIRQIELELGHLHIHCELHADFWAGQPEIVDARLSDWLAARIFHGRQLRGPAPVALIPKGKGTFRVHLITLPHASSNGLSRIGRAAALDGASKDKGQKATMHARGVHA